MKLRLSSMLSVGVVCAVALALFVSGATLNNLGMNYSANDTGGLKIHPYSMLLAPTFVLLVAVLVGKRRIDDLAGIRSALAGMVFVVLVVAWKMASGGGQSLGFIVDTILDAFLFAMVLPFTSRKTGARLTMLFAAFFGFECLMALFEVVTRTNLIPVDTWYGGSFRSTALQGHPLNNALIVVVVAVSLQPFARRWVSVLIFLFTVAALTAFGARGALVAYVFINAWRLARFGLGSARAAAVTIVGGIAGAALLGWFVLSGVVGERIARVGTNDDSSEVRFQSLGILAHLDWRHVLLGSTANEIDHFMGQESVLVVENFVVGYLLSFGALITLALFYWLYRAVKPYFGGLPLEGRRELAFASLAFAMTAVTNNSLMTKTPALCLYVVGLWCIRERCVQRRARQVHAVPDERSPNPLSHESPECCRTH